MNKLEEIYKKAAEKSTIENYYPEYNSYLSESLFIDEAKEITTDIAIKFAEWIAKHGYSKQLYEVMIIYKVKTTQELFDEFINNHYGK